MRSPFRYFNSSPEVIRLTVMLYIRYPLSLGQVEDLAVSKQIGLRDAKPVPSLRRCKIRSATSTAHPK